MAEQYQISDPAYNKLSLIAQRQSYIPIGAQRLKGMSTFLEDLSKQKFMDTRPQHILLRHNLEIRAGRAPVWRALQYPRRTRLLTLTEKAQERYIILALAIGIITEEPFVVGGPSRLTNTPTISHVLEAIGLGWITPEKLPIASKKV